MPEDAVGGEPARLDDVVRPVVLGGQLGHVLALVALFGHDVAAAAGEQALAEEPYLAARVVDVELPPHLPSRSGS